MAKKLKNWHGTTGGYTNHGCRCLLCRAANNARMKRYRHSDAPKDLTHGTHSSYAVGCRCEPCKQAHRITCRRKPKEKTLKRRDFAKQIAAVATTHSFSSPSAIYILGQSDGERSFDSATISVRLAEEVPGMTSVLLTEHGDADEAIVLAFFWATLKGLKLLLHKETTAPLVKGTVVQADLPMPIKSIAFLRVKELKLLHQSEFGKTS
jgi:hypothetical protein